MMKNLKIITFSFLFLVFNFNAQKQNSNWYFGVNSGLNFNTSPTSILTNGQINTLNKSASISDNQGNLLFYTNGKTVWNKNHSIMQNGNQTLKSSSSNDYESVLILPIPNSTKYYIFTEEASSNDPEVGFISTYYFSIVNMNSNNGLGNVEVLNKILLPSIRSVNGVQIYYNKSHNMTSALHADGENYWLILNPDAYFYSFHITSNILLENPSYISSSINNQNTSAKSNCTQYSRISSLKSSPASNKLASVLNSGSSCLASSVLNVYDFDNSTGIVNNFLSSNTDVPDYFSLEFSPNGDYLYILNSDGASNNNFIKIYDVNNPQVYISKILIPNSQNKTIPRGNTIQRGIDGDLYFLDEYGNQNISVIENSNAPNNVLLLHNSIVSSNPIGQFPKLIPYNECELIIVITKNIVFGEIYNRSAQGSITASNMIESGANVNYDAGSSIHLLSGFRAKSGANFKAFIEGCNQNSYQNKSGKVKTKLLLSSEITEKENDLLNIYPNPTNGVFKISSSETIINYSVINQFNVIVINNRVMNNIVEVDIQNLPKSIYFIKVQLKNGKTITKKIVKN